MALIAKNGGYREGSGRPPNTGKYKEVTVPVRVPVSLVPKVMALLDKLEKKVKKESRSEK